MAEQPSPDTDGDTEPAPAAARQTPADTADTAEAPGGDGVLDGDDLLAAMTQELVEQSAAMW